MRIVYLIADPGIPLDGKKGATQHVQGVRSAFERGGHEVILLAVNPGRLEDGERVLRISVGSAEGEERFRAAQSWIVDHATGLSQRLGSVDIVLERLALFPSAGHRLARALGAIHLLEVNAPLAQEAASHRRLAARDEAQRLEDRAIAEADGVVTVSRTLTRQAIELRGGSHGVLHLPNGVDVSRFQAARGERETMRARIGAEPGRCVVAFVGTLKPWHGADRLLAAAEAARRRGADIQLLVIGDGPEGKALVTRASAGPLADRFAFTGAIDASEVPQWLAAADVGAAFYPPLDSFYFSPLKVAEYASAGLPIARSTNVEMDDLVPPDAGCVVVPPGDVEAFAEALTRLAADPELRAQLGARAAERARAALDWSIKVETILGFAAKLRVTV